MLSRFPGASIAGILPSVVLPRMIHLSCEIQSYLAIHRTVVFVNLLISTRIRSRITQDNARCAPHFCELPGKYLSTVVV
jgi:hypothetical protein